MKLQKISMQNFMSYGEEQTLNLSKDGLFLITGINHEQISAASNGAGKSTAIDAICFALFGSITKDMTLPELVNEQMGKDCQVTLWFELDGSNYRIERYINHTKYHDKILFYKNEVLISKANKKDTQELIDQLIKINFKSFVNSVVMSQENVGKFLDADPSKKKEIVENILQLNIITQYHVVAQAKRKLAKKNYDRVDVEITNFESLIQNTKDSAMAYVASCKKQKDIADKKVLDLKDRLLLLESTDIESERMKIKKASDAKISIESKKSEYKTKLALVESLDSQISTLEDSKDEYSSLIKLNEKTIKKFSDEITIFESGIKKNLDEINHAKAHPDQCPLCKNLINIDELNKWVEEKQKLVDIAQKTIDDKKKSINENTQKSKELQEKLDDIETQISNIENERKTKKNDADIIKKEYENIEIPKTMNEEDLDKIADEISLIKSQIKNLEETEYKDQKYLDNLLEKAKELNIVLKQKRDESQKYSKNLLLYQWWENSLSSKKNSMKSWCINNIIGYFNTRIKYYMDRFFDGDTEIQLDIELNEVIKRNNYERSFAAFSGGEKQRLNLAILFALNNLVKSNLSTKLNIMFLDEILSTSLDEKGISTVLGLLEDMKDEKETVFIIDHKDNFKDYPAFEHILIEKDKDGFSSIKQK